MSQENIDLHRRFVAAINARDPDAFIALCDPRIELHPTISAVSGAVYHGHDGVLEWRGDIEEAWGDDFRLELEAYFDLGGQTLAFYLARGRGRLGHGTPMYAGGATASASTTRATPTRRMHSWTWASQRTH